MAIHLHRSNRSEHLIEMLCTVLRAELPSDPFQQFPVVVGSRGMERWLRHEIATRMDIAANLAFPFPRQVLGSAAQWLLNGAQDRDASFWELGRVAMEGALPWDRQALAFRLVGLLRGHAEDADFATTARYLAEGAGAGSGSGDPPVTARELLFAAEVGDVLDRLMHDRPDDVLAWSAEPSEVPEEHRWLAALLADIEAGTDASSPAVVYRALRRTAPIQTGRSMCIFGLSTMGPGERARLEAIARSIDVHLFILVPTDRWFGHQRTRVEANAARRDTVTEDDRKLLEAELASDNPVLISLGAPSRDNQAWLEEVGYQADHLNAEDPAALAEGVAAPRLLHRLQGWILAADGLDAVAEPWPPEAGVPSVSAHSGYGALRQCEVLRDELLGMFAADPTLEPRDVVVMTPDIETYAPLVAAVFSRTGVAALEADAEADAGRARTHHGQHRLPRIPVSIADLGLRRTNPVAEVLLAVLEIPGERFTATWLADFLALSPVRLRWALDDDDLADLRDMLRDSGIRWGIDAADRAVVGQPELDQNTARFGLERLALGVLIPDETDLGVIGDLSGALGPAVPLDIISRDRVRRVGQLTAIIRTITAHRIAMAEPKAAPATLATWRTRLVSALDDLAAVGAESAWLRSEVDSALDDMVRVGAALGDVCVERSAVMRWLQGGFELPQHGDRAITGAVQVCALEPMRSVPFRVVALLGMDDKAFPRGGQARTWDPMEQRRAGERDRRAVDRHLMLEAILSARDRLLLLWSGHDVNQGKEQPAAVPVEELLETLGRLTGSTRAELVREHALQPWSANNFGQPSGGFDAGMAVSARHLREIAGGSREATSLGLAMSGAAALPPEEFMPTSLGLDDLADALCSPHRLLLRDRLGLSVSTEEAALEDREPLELDTLESWVLRERVVGHLTSGDHGGIEATTDAKLLDALEARVAGEGALPLRAGGRVVLAQEVAKSRDLLLTLDAVDGAPADGLDLRIALQGGFQLLGRVGRVRTRDRLSADGASDGTELLLQWHSVSKESSSKMKMAAWLHLLTAVALGHPVVGARLVGWGDTSTAKKAAGDFLMFEGGPDEARAQLEEFVALWRRARTCPVPLFVVTSYKAAEVLHAFGSSAGVNVRLRAAVSEGWSGTKQIRGDTADRWIGTFFGDYDPLDHLDDVGEHSLLGLAERVWQPLVRGLEAGVSLAQTWKMVVPR
jgi:exodeoxyribonuclease V gamma subunit